MGNSMQGDSMQEGKKPDFPSPGEEAREVFVAALGIAKGMLDEGNLRIDVDDRGMVDISVEDKAIEAIPEEKLIHGLTHKQLSALFPTEIESLAQAATHKDPIQGLQLSMPSSVLEEVGEEEFMWRLKETKRALVNDDIRERATFRRTATGFVLASITWQIVIKKWDESSGELPEIPRAMVTIAYSQPRAVGTARLVGPGIQFAFPTVVEPKEVALELHRADIDKIIDALTKAKKHLEKRGKGK